MFMFNRSCFSMKHHQTGRTPVLQGILCDQFFWQIKEKITRLHFDSSLSTRTTPQYTYILNDFYIKY